MVQTAGQITDLCVYKFSLRIHSTRRPQDKKAPKRLAVLSMDQDSIRQGFINYIGNLLGAMDPRDQWTQKTTGHLFQNVVDSSAANTL